MSYFSKIVFINVMIPFCLFYILLCHILPKHLTFLSSCGASSTVLNRIVRVVYSWPWVAIVEAFTVVYNTGSLFQLAKSQTQLSNWTELNWSWLLNFASCFLCVCLNVYVVSLYLMNFTNWFLGDRWVGKNY